MVHARVLLLALLVFPAGAAGFDAFSDTRSPPHFRLLGPDGLALVLKGRLQVEWRDLEGEGGTGRDSETDTETLGTRSGHAAVDELRLAFRVETPDAVAVYTEVAFTPTSARAEGAWLDYRARWAEGLAVHGEAGLHTPFVAVDDETARAPLTSRIYWGQPEMHLTAQLSGPAGPLGWWCGLSAAVMRPLGTTPVNDATDVGTLSVLSYGSARPFSGNAPVFGAKAGLGVGPYFAVEGFGFIGWLAAEKGIDELRNRIAGFSLLPGFDRSAPRDQDDTFGWVGGRADAAAFGARARAEWIGSQESLIRRWAGYLQLGYVWQRTEALDALLRTVELRVRAERYRIVDADIPLAPGRALRAADPSQALTWDWDVLTAALASQLYRDLLWLHVEYSLIDEHNGASGLGRPDAPVRNDELLVHLELRF